MPKKSARRLTEAGISRLPAAPEGERVEHADALAPGLVLRISDTGSKRWQVRFRVGGRAARMSLGAWPDLTLAEARKRAREVREQADAGVDPRDAREAEKRRAEAEARKEAEAARTFGDLAEAYVGRECSRLANGRELESLIRRELIPELGAVPLGDFRRRDMVRLLDRLMDAGQAAKARKLHWLGCRIFRWALGRDEIETDPLAGLPTPAAHRSRDRVLGDGELALLWEAWERQGFPFGSMGRLLLLTGARRSEVAEMRWRELDDGDDPALWTLPAERTKTGEARVIPLSSAARAVLAEVPRWALTGEFVFTTTAGRRPGSASRPKSRRSAALSRQSPGGFMTSAAPPGRYLRAWACRMKSPSGASGMSAALDFCLLITGTNTNQKWPMPLSGSPPRCSASPRGAPGRRSWRFGVDPRQFRRDNVHPRHSLARTLDLPVPRCRRDRADEASDGRGTGQRTPDMTIRTHRG